MAKYFRRRGDSLAPFCMCLYFLICWQASADLNVNKRQVKSNEFDVSVKTINGRVYVNWNAMSSWQNTTVYFISHLYDEVHNTSYDVNISLCHAIKYDKDSWRIESTKGSLLEFCNKSKRCWLVKTKSDSLISATVNKKMQELSCQLFTTCTNFEDVFRIQVVSFGGDQEYSFQSGNISIYSENIPPISKALNVNRETLAGSDAVLEINYFQPSELCGFGSKPSDSIQFVVNFYKTNDTNCFYMGQKIVPFNKKLTKVKFAETIRKTEVMYFYVTVKSSTNNKTTASQRYTLGTHVEDYNFSVTGGVINLSWRPRWNCFGENIIEQAQYCYKATDCFPVCEVSFFANGTFRKAKTYDSKIINACKSQNSCKVEISKSTPFITVSWSPETRRISCVFFETCVNYADDSFKAKLSTLNDAGTVVLNERHIASGVGLGMANVPAIPQNVTATNITENQITITWRSKKCEIKHFGVEIFLVVDGAVENVKKDNAVEIDMYFVYSFTISNLRPYQNIKYQAYAYSEENFSSSERSPLKTVRTKPSVPDFEPTLTNIQSEGRGIRLTWKLPNVGYWKGLPNETRIIGTDENSTHVYYRGTFYTERMTTAWFVVNETQRCAFYRVKFCNAPHLCSNYSSRYQLVDCAQGRETSRTPPDSPPSSSENIWIVISVSIAVLLVVIISATTTYFYYQKKRRRMRPRLPKLEVEKNHSEHYIPVGQVSNSGEYDSLDKEECLDELVT